MRKLVLTLAVMLALLAAGVTRANAVIPNIITCAVTQGTLGISWSGDTATATASGFSVGGGSGQFVYTWSPGGAQGASVTFAPGTVVQFALSIICDGAVVWQGNSPTSTAPTGGGGCTSNCGGGGSGSVPTVTLGISTPNPQPAGNTAIISYSATGTPTSCYVTVQGGYAGGVPVPGSSTVTYNIGSVQQTSLVQLTCANIYGTSAVASATITVQSASQPPPPPGPTSCTQADGCPVYWPDQNGDFGFPVPPLGPEDAECPIYPAAPAILAGQLRLSKYVGYNFTVGMCTGVPMAEISVTACLSWAWDPSGVHDTAEVTSAWHIVSCQTTTKLSPAFAFTVTAKALCDYTTSDVDWGAAVLVQGKSWIGGVGTRTTHYWSVMRGTDPLKGQCYKAGL